MDLDVIKPCIREIVRVWGGLEKIQSLCTWIYFIPLSRMRYRAFRPFGSGFLDREQVRVRLFSKKNCSWMPPGHRMVLLCHLI